MTFDIFANNCANRKMNSYYSIVVLFAICIQTSCSDVTGDDQTLPQETTDTLEDENADDKEMEEINDLYLAMINSAEWAEIEYLLEIGEALPDSLEKDANGNTWVYRRGKFTGTFMDLRSDGLANVLIVEDRNGRLIQMNCFFEAETDYSNQEIMVFWSESQPDYGDEPGTYEERTPENVDLELLAERITGARD
jgi:hypothetical protein